MVVYVGIDPPKLIFLSHLSKQMGYSVAVADSPDAVWWTTMETRLVPSVAMKRMGRRIYKRR